MITFIIWSFLCFSAENPYFSEALVSWDAERLFNGGFSLLSSLRRTQYYQSFTSGVTFDVRENCVALSTDSATITLGTYVYISIIYLYIDAQLNDNVLCKAELHRFQNVLIFLICKFAA